MAGTYGGYDGLAGVVGRNGYHSAAATSASWQKGMFGRVNGVVSGSHGDIAMEGEEKTSIDDIEKRLNQVR